VPVTTDDVKHIAHLARLHLEDDEVAAYEHDLNRILGLFDQIEAIDTDTLAPLAHPLDLVQRLRPDHADAVVDRDAYQAIAPRTEDGLYIVPKVIE
jgi:aspartyl-tRNA(Asn)/glutamyl-tRNA(Gln) amidotransferase subunit C